jgi:3-oxoacyl-[acyl-carrier-protein] synthase II
MEMETISPLGVSVERHFEAVCRGESGGDFIRQFDASEMPTKFACEVKKDISYLVNKERSDIRASLPYDRKAELFVACVELMRERVCGQLQSVNSENVGTFVGVGTETLSLAYLSDGSLMGEDEGLEEFYRQNSRYPNVNKLLNPSNYLTLYSASKFNSRGPRETHVSACAASAQALGAAFESIASGRCSVALVSGMDSTINPFILSAFSLLSMISTRNSSPKTASRPFDVGRDGFVPGEGAGIVVLANEEEAARWGSPPLARLAGYGASLDAYKITAPRPEGLGAQLAMKRALRSAGWRPETVDYINAHGTSTPLNDISECRAFEAVFGDALSSIKVSSTKSQIGHLIAAGGIVEFITVVCAINRRVVPPSINVFNQDALCAISLVKETEVGVRIERALSNSFALAGINATLAIEAVEKRG